MAVPGIVAVVEIIAIGVFVVASHRGKREAVAEDAVHAVVKNDGNEEPAAQAKPAPRPPELHGKPFAAPVVVAKIIEPDRGPKVDPKIEPKPRIDPKPAPPPAAVEDFWESPRWTEAKLAAKAAQASDVGLDPMAVDALRQFIEAGLRADAENDHGAVKKLIRERADLAGLPFLVDDRSRLNPDAAHVLAEQAAEIHKTFSRVDGAIPFWDDRCPPGAANAAERRWTIASAGALEHILATRPADYRRVWMERLASGTEPESTRTLARRALFDWDPSVRRAAVRGLKSRPSKDAGDALVDGFRYPWVPVARHAAEALVTLDRKDLVPRLKALAREPDPYTLPRKPGEDFWTIREVVRLNHFQNCLLCHAPMAAPAALDARARLTLPVGNAAAKGVRFAQAYDNGLDLFARADVAYLWPDFSGMLEVKKRVAEATGWSQAQRFDFVVRTRRLTPQESVLWPAAATLDDSANGKSLAFAISQLTR